MVSKQSFGTAPDGTPVSAFELADGNALVRVMDFGATLLGVTVPDREGTPADVVLGFGSLEGYLDNPACYGATIGPSANRTDGGEVTIGGVRYQLPQNDGPDKRNNLHTDLDHGLHKRVWHAEAEPRSCSVTFSTTLEDGELGLPGRRTFSATYTLAATEAGSDLTIRYACETDAPTFVNMTSHTYFNLAGHDAGSVDAQLVSLDATDFLPIREDSVSAGEVRPVAGTPFDFRTAKPLGQDVGADDEQLARARGYDHCFCINGFAEGRPRATPCTRRTRQRTRPRRPRHDARRPPLHGQLAWRRERQGRGLLHPARRLCLRAGVLARQHASRGVEPPRLRARPPLRPDHRLPLLDALRRAHAERNHHDSKRCARASRPRHEPVRGRLRAGGRQGALRPRARPLRDRRQPHGP